MKKYLLFGYDQFYPSGGWDDFIESYDDIHDIIKYISKEIKEESEFVWDEYDIVDREMGVKLISIVYDSKKDRWDVINRLYDSSNTIFDTKKWEKEINKNR